MADAYSILKSYLLRIYGITTTDNAQSFLELSDSLFDYSRV